MLLFEFDFHRLRRIIFIFKGIETVKKTSEWTAVP